jgi:hypothetical protein
MTYEIQRRTGYCAPAVAVESHPVPDQQSGGLRVVGASDTLGIVHIPKTGGTSVAEALHGLDGVSDRDLYYEPELITGVDVGELPWERRSQFASVGQLRHLCVGNRLLIGHFTAQSLVAAGCSHLAVQLREPRARILSLYRYWQSLSEGERTGWGVWGSKAVASSHLPFNQFLRSPHVWAATNNAMARQLVVTTTLFDPRHLVRQIEDELGGRGYDRFRGRLAIAAWSDQAQEFVDRICAEFLLQPPVEVRRENVTDVVGDREVIDADDRGLLDELTRLDTGLLNRLMGDGHLLARTTGELEDEWEETAHRLRFDLR